MPYVVDTIEVEPDVVARYLEAVEQLGVPVMTDAGARFVSCATTAADIGETVDVQVVWAFDDHAQWNVIRKNMVLDPRWYEYSDTVAALRTGGTRRVFYRRPFLPAVIRRFEIYRVATGRPAARRGRPGDRLPAGADGSSPRSCTRWWVGTGSAAPARLVWEHAFASAAAYQRYMVHPFHANVLDRYLLPDSPERVVVDDDLGAGLVGYHCDGPVFALAGGIRRLVLLRVDRGASAADVSGLTDRIERARAEAAGVILSVVGANTLGPAWFDGVTPMTGRPRWTHVWEQGFCRYRRA